MGYGPLTKGLKPIICFSMTKEIIELIEQQSAARGVAISTFCRLAVNDGKLHARLMSGKTITFATLDKINRFIAENPVSADALG